MVWGQKGPLDHLLWHSVSHVVIFDQPFLTWTRLRAHTASLHLEAIRRLKLLPSIGSFVLMANSLAVSKCGIRFWFDLTFSFFLGFAFQTLVLVMPFFTQLNIPSENNTTKKSKNAFPSLPTTSCLCLQGLCLAIFTTLHWVFLFSCLFVVTSKSFLELLSSRM